MTIYTLFLYVAIAALLFWGSIGYGHARLKKYASTQPIQWYIQYFLACLLLFSGFVKAVDPMGTGYKMKDYFVEFNSQGFPLMETLTNWSLEFSVLMIVLELVLGFALLLGIGGALTTWGTFLMMIFFTFLTGFNYLTGYTPSGVGFFQFGKWGAFQEAQIRIKDCGCFGDFMKLKPVETFVKDIILTLMAIPLILRNFRMKEILPKTFAKPNPDGKMPKPRVYQGVIGFLTLASFIFCLQNFYFDLPLLDFRPFAVGVNIPKAKAACTEQNKNAAVTLYTYRNKSTQEEVQINKNDVVKPENKHLWDTNTWEILSDKTTEKVVGEKCDSKVQFFTHPELEADTNYNLFVLIYDIDKTNQNGFKNIVKLATEAEKNGLKVRGVYYHITDANGDGNTDDDVDKFRHKHQAAFPIEKFGDDKLIPTITRSDPGLMLFKAGTVIKKWHHRKAPSSFEELKSFLK
jgi:uncharacterized membrane protein YphA (DoxX/SURF4 family)